MKDAVIKRRGAFEQLVGGILHRKQLWFHGPITREESEARIKIYGMRDGLFLMRERTKVNSYALVVSYQNIIYHYLLDMNTLGQLSIENGRKFENLLQVVDHYSRTADGLLCVLTDLCAVNLFQGEGVVVQPQVMHGPRRIDDSEIITQAELGHSSLSFPLSLPYSFLFLPFSPSFPPFLSLLSSLSLPPFLPFSPSFPPFLSLLSSLSLPPFLPFSPSFPPFLSLLSSLSPFTPSLPQCSC